MKPSDGTFLDLCGDALPGALVHARTHRSLQRRVYETPLGGGGGGGGGGCSHTGCPRDSMMQWAESRLIHNTRADSVAARGC